MRVNLMRSNEFRRQGAVSGAFVVRATIGAILLYGSFFASLAVVNYQIARRDLLAAREIWRLREPIYNAVQAMKHDLAEMKKIQQELAGWRAARVTWDERLLSLQEITPPVMQMRRLSVRGDQELVKEKGMTSAVGIPARRYFVDIDGFIASEDANEVVKVFLEKLEQSPAYSNFWQSLTLQGLRRELRASSDQQEWSFSVQAVSRRTLFQ